MAKINNGVHDYTEEEDYIVPESPEVCEHIEWFRDLKLGFMMHWAPVTQLGLVESWALSDGDASWSRGGVDWTEDAEEFKKQYWALNKTFNPVKFRPDRWARLAKECGFKYLLFTTKHHDGFCMYDSKFSDYKVTAPDCPFSADRNADIVRALYDAFRAEGLGISTYFSKPDWHSDYYWRREFGNAPTRNVNYDIKEHPDLWEKFVEYTHAQMTELTSNYGKVDVLWLDGGWVCPQSHGQDIRLGEVVEKIRSTTQPHLIVCDRTVGGKYENVVTPEQNIPPEPMNIPWETCMTVGRCFSFQYDDVCKTPIQVVQSFIDIVAKGGNLALNITPQPDGDLPTAAVNVLRELGGWLAANGEGIYGTRISQYRLGGQPRLTHKADAEYLFYLYADTPEMPFKLNLKIDNLDKKIAEITLLRSGEKIGFTQDGINVTLDTETVSRTDMRYADCFKITFAK